MTEKQYIARSMEKKELRFTPKTKKDTPIVKPRNAASLVLLKTTSKGVRVLLGKRSDKTRFMPGAWVFPGGVLDKNDFKTHKIMFFESQTTKPVVFP